MDEKEARLMEMIQDRCSDVIFETVEEIAKNKEKIDLFGIEAIAFTCVHQLIEKKVLRFY